MVVEAEIFPAVLSSLRDPDDYVVKNVATLIREIAKHTPEVSREKGEGAKRGGKGEGEAGGERREMGEGGEGRGGKERRKGRGGKQGERDRRRGEGRGGKGDERRERGKQERDKGRGE